MNEQLINAKNINLFVIFLFLFSFVPFAFSQNVVSSEVGMIKAISGKVWLNRGDKKEERGMGGEGTDACSQKVQDGKTD